MRSGRGERGRDLILENKQGLGRESLNVLHEFREDVQEDFEDEVENAKPYRHRRHQQSEEELEK